MGLNKHNNLEDGVNNSKVKNFSSYPLAYTIDPYDKRSIPTAASSNEEKELKITKFATADNLKVIKHIFLSRKEMGLDLYDHLDQDLLDIKKNYFNNKGNFWVIKNNRDEILATMGIKSIKKAHFGLTSLYIHKSIRGRGLGEKLMKKAISHAKENRIENLVLSTCSGFKEARRIIEKLGFQLSNKSDFCSVTDLNYVMKLKYE